MELHEFDSGLTHWFGSWNDTLIAFWSNHANIAILDAALRNTQRLSRQFKRRVFSLTVIDATDTPKLDPMTRVHAAELNKRSAQDVAFVAQVVEGKGLRASAVRAILTGMNLVNSQPTRASDNVFNAAMTLVQHGALGQADQLTKAVEKARKQWMKKRGAQS